MYIKISINQSELYIILQKILIKLYINIYNYMNTKRLAELIKKSGKTKVQIAKSCGITRVTLDNALVGGDIRISIVESIANALNVKVGYLFDEDCEPSTIATANDHSVAAINSEIKIDNTDLLQERIKHLEEMLAEKERLIKVLMK